MQDFGTKADNSPPPGGQLSAAEFNNLATENENAVLRAGLTLSGASETQLAQSAFLHAVKAGAFQDSGLANAYVATPISGANGVLLPSVYTPMDGATIGFSAANANSTASTLNIGQTTGTLLGAKKILDSAGGELISGAITAGAFIELRYNSTMDSGNGAWILLPWSKFTGQTLPAGYFSGLTLANNSGAPNTTIDVAAGSARDSTNTVDIVLTATLRGILQSSGAWAAGDNQNKLDAGAKAINSTYHKFAIGHPTLADDILFSLSPTAPTMPSGYVGFRRIGRAITDGLGNIRAFKDRGNGHFDWVTPSVEITAGPVAPSTSLLTLAGLGGAPVLAKAQVFILADGGAIRLTPTDVTDAVTGDGETTWTGGAVGSAGGGSAAEAGAGEFLVKTDTAGQVRMRIYGTGGGNVRYRVITFGWVEVR